MCGRAPELGAAEPSQGKKATCASSRSHQPGGEGVGAKGGCKLQQAVEGGEAAHAEELAGERGHQAPVAAKGEAGQRGRHPQQRQAGRRADQAHACCEAGHSHQECSPAGRKLL